MSKVTRKVRFFAIPSTEKYKDGESIFRDQMLLKTLIDSNDRVFSTKTSKITLNDGTNCEIEYQYVFNAKSSQMTKQAKLIRPVGGRAHTILSAIFPKKHYEAIFQQAIADMRDECDELDAAGHTNRRRWINFISHVGLCLSVFNFLVTAIAKKIVSMWKIL